MNKINKGVINSNLSNEVKSFLKEVGIENIDGFKINAPLVDKNKGADNDTRVALFSDSYKGDIIDKDLLNVYSNKKYDTNLYKLIDFEEVNDYKKVLYWNIPFKNKYSLYYTTNNSEDYLSYINIEEDKEGTNDIKVLKEKHLKLRPVLEFEKKDYDYELMLEEREVLFFKYNTFFSINNRVIHTSLIKEILTSFNIYSNSLYNNLLLLSEDNYLKINDYRELYPKIIKHNNKSIDKKWLNYRRVLNQLPIDYIVSYDKFKKDNKVSDNELKILNNLLKLLIFKKYKEEEEDICKTFIYINRNNPLFIYNFLKNNHLSDLMEFIKDIMEISESKRNIAIELIKLLNYKYYNLNSLLYFLKYTDDINKESEKSFSKLESRYREFNKMLLIENFKISNYYKDINEEKKLASIFYLDEYPVLSIYIRDLITINDLNKKVLIESYNGNNIGNYFTKQMIRDLDSALYNLEESLNVSSYINSQKSKMYEALRGIFRENYIKNNLFVELLNIILKDIFYYTGDFLKQSSINNINTRYSEAISKIVDLGIFLNIQSVKNDNELDHLIYSLLNTKRNKLKDISNIDELLNKLNEIYYLHQLYKIIILNNNELLLNKIINEIGEESNIVINEGEEESNMSIVFNSLLKTIDYENKLLRKGCTNWNGIGVTIDDEHIRYIESDYPTFKFIKDKDNNYHIYLKTKDSYNYKY